MEIPSKAAKTQGLKGILYFKTVKDGIIALLECFYYEINCLLLYHIWLPCMILLSFVTLILPQMDALYHSLNKQIVILGKNTVIMNTFIVLLRTI